MFTTFQYHIRIISYNHFKKFIALDFVTSLGIGQIFELNVDQQLQLKTI